MHSRKEADMEVAMLKLAEYTGVTNGALIVTVVWLTFTVRQLKITIQEMKTTMVNAEAYKATETGRTESITNVKNRVTRLENDTDQKNATHQ